MPLEGHWDRLNTPLRETTPRERLLVRAFAALLGIAAMVAIVFFVLNGSSSPSTPPGCIRIEIGSTMGGGASQLCGDTARAYCQGPAGRTVASQCHETGLPARRQ